MTDTELSHAPAPLSDDVVYMGRQPIFDRNKKTIAYQLLHRSSEVNAANPDEATKIMADKAGVSVAEYEEFEAGTNIFTPVALPADPSLTELNTNSRERAVEGYASLQSDLGAQVQSFAGVRVSRLHRASERSDGSRAVAYDQTVTTPWAGLAWSPSSATMLYASWGQGAELEAVPNRPSRFVNYGEALPALKSKQVEIGGKWQLNPRMLLTAAAFSIDKPYADDVATTSGIPRRVAGGKEARHRGVELAATGRLDEALSLQASLMLLDAKYTRAVDPALVDQRVTNVPRSKASLFADYKVAAVPGLALNALATYESGKTATADGSVQFLAPCGPDTAGCAALPVGVGPVVPEGHEREGSRECPRRGGEGRGSGEFDPSGAVVHR